MRDDHRTRVAPTTPTVTEEPAPDTTTSTTTDRPAPQEDAPADWPTGELDGVLTYVDAEDCRIRTIGLSSGRPRPPSRFVTDCRGFWAPKIGSRVAFGEVLSEGFFRIADLGHPRRDFGVVSDRRVDTLPMWSPDGQRIAWCDSPNTGIEREILGQGRVLPFCPIAYTPDGGLAHAEGRRLVAGGRTLVEAPEPIDFAAIAVDGSIGLVLEGFDVVRYVGGEQVARTGPLQGQISGPPIFSPDGCILAVPLFSTVGLIRLCSGEIVFDEVPGTEATFSPDGSSLAVNGPDGITFHSLDDGLEVQAVWPADAAQLAWRVG